MSSHINTKENWQVIPVLEGAKWYDIAERLRPYDARIEVYQYLTSTDTTAGEANRFINETLCRMGKEGLVSILERMFWDLRPYYTTPAGHYIDGDKYDLIEKINKDRYMVWTCTGQAEMPLVYLLEALRKVSLVCRMPD